MKFNRACKEYYKRKYSLAILRPVNFDLQTNKVLAIPISGGCLREQISQLISYSLKRGSKRYYIKWCNTNSLSLVRDNKKLKWSISSNTVFLFHRFSPTFSSNYFLPPSAFLVILQTWSFKVVQQPHYSLVRSFLWFYKVKLHLPPFHTPFWEVPYCLPSFENCSLHCSIFRFHPFLTQNSYKYSKYLFGCFATDSRFPTNAIEWPSHMNVIQNHKIIKIWYRI